MKISDKIANEGGSDSSGITDSCLGLSYDTVKL